MRRTRSLGGRRKSKQNVTPIQTVRIVMFGLGGVGKTSLIHRFLFSKFDSTYTATIEDDYRQVITYNNHIVDVTVLDTAGSYQFPAMRKHAIQNGQGFLLVYAIDDVHSLDEITRLYKEVKSVKGTDKIPVIVVGNKLDKCAAGKRKIDREHVNDVVRSWGNCVEHIETSAKVDKNVSLLFNKMIWIIDEVSVEKRQHSVAYSTVYDQTPNGNIPNRTISMDHSAMALNRESIDMDTQQSSRAYTTSTRDYRTYSVDSGSLAKPNRAFSVDNSMTKNDCDYRGRLYTWEEESQEKVEKAKKKQKFLPKLFTRKSVS